MKRIMRNGIAAAAAAGLALSAAAAWAEDAKPAPKPAAANPAAMKDANALPAAHKSRRREDARACLERTSDAEVIKCAEAYL